jgi:hypothetical protein
MDKILNLLMEQGRIEKVPLGAKSAAASLAFVMWNKLKPCVVVDLQAINMKLFLEAYLLP